MAIRKRAKKSKAMAIKHDDRWRKKRLPSAKPLERCLSKRHEHPGVYVLLNQGDPIYVGETINVRGRIEQILNTKSWMKFAPTSVKVIDTSDERPLQQGLHSHLIGRLNPVLNSSLLRPVSQPDPEKSLVAVLA